MITFDILVLIHGKVLIFPFLQHECILLSMELGGEIKIHDSLNAPRINTRFPGVGLKGRGVW